MSEQQKFSDDTRDFKSDCKKLCKMVLNLNYKKFREIILKNKIKTFFFLCIVIFLFLLLQILFTLKNIECRTSGDRGFRHYPTRR